LVHKCQVKKSNQPFDTSFFIFSRLIKYIKRAEDKDEGKKQNVTEMTVIGEYWQALASVLSIETILHML
jgi:hypothetical protein